MVIFPNCKINLGLNIICKREDGYHDLETIFYPVSVKDALEVIQAKENSFHLTGLPVIGSAENNLCVKAYHLLKKDFPALPPVSIHLHKVIPMGAGLGGGSADGAFMLQLLNKKFDLKLSAEKLMQYSLQLGSDCPFFIINTPCFATGRGENLTPINLDLSSYKIVIVNPGIHVSTKEAFSKLTPTPPLVSLQQLIELPIEEWKNRITNNFEKAVFQLFPGIESIKKEFYDKGALYASLTGSGSTVFGIFDKKSEVNFSLPRNYTLIDLS